MRQRLPFLVIVNMLGLTVSSGCRDAESERSQANATIIASSNGLERVASAPLSESAASDRASAVLGGVRMQDEVSSMSERRDTVAETESRVDALIARLRSGDKGALEELAQFRSEVYEALAEEFLDPKDELAEHLAFRALSNMNDNRVIMLVARKRFFDPPRYWGGGRFMAQMDLYLWTVTNQDPIIGNVFDTFEQYEKWYGKNKDKIDWKGIRHRLGVWY